ncbi:putative ribosome-binding factor A, mitochondrial isoform X1 [Papilio machaon]|uniref:putative ribosome-binding factor A, mitochondrial isoform X1 n=1 Tax=Papilio machaon TaxID=76193 RepID=UPI001E6632C6|nr:putative ribosome-binding factor A, mitochondrial isoform X1 [Papilio machaon]
MLRRFYHVSATLHSVKKQGIKLTKMINPKMKKQWYPSETMNSNPMPSIKSLTKIKNEPGKRGIRRVAVLNKVFMKYITDIMSTGTVAINIVGKGIEISKVRVTPDFLTVNVFWVCKGDSTDEETESLLNTIAGALRHELSTLRVMGEVPYIVFVKDKQEAQIADLDRRLTVADFGEDYTPTDVGHMLKTEFTLNTKLSPEMKAKIAQLEAELPVTEDPLPEMTHNVYGLDHALIMNRLLAARRRSKDAWSSLKEDSPVITYRAPENKGTEVDTGKQKQELADFLLRRQILESKLRKQKFDNREWVEENEDREVNEYDEDFEEDYFEDYDDLDYDERHLQSSENKPPLK